MRLFLALDLPEAIRERIAAIQRDLREHTTGWRWVRPAGVHLTVRFLGEVAATDEAALRAGWRSAAASSAPVRLRIGGLGVFPPRGRARVLWAGIVELEPGCALQTLASAVEEAARAAGFPPERREFRPHLTLARAARAARPSLPVGVGTEEVGEFSADELVLFRSHLSPAGARYERLEAFPLGSGTRP